MLLKVKRDKKGFTLIELLIVIAIIGVLASVVLVSLINTKQKARDAARLKEIKSIQSALEIFYAANGRYPSSVSCGATVPSAGWCNSVQSQDGNGHWIKHVGVAAFSGKDPVDPSPATAVSNISTDSGVFFYYGFGNDYMLVFRMENAHSLQNGDGYTTCPSPTYPNGQYYHYGSGLTVTIGNCATR